MRWTAALALIVACGGNGSQGGGSAQIVIDIPNGPLDPKGFTDLDLVLHESGGDVARSAKLGPNMTFDLGDLEPDKSVWVEATLRNDVGAAVGYGRTANAVAFAKGTEIDVQVRRPIVYVAGLVSTEVGQPPPPPNPPTLSWSESSATVSDLSLGGALDGSSQLSEQAVLMIDAGPNLFMVEQQVNSSSGALTGAATIKPVAMADHKLGAALSGTMTGGVIDGAGTDDGNTLVIGTTTNLFGVDATTGVARSLASGEFDRVAVMTTPTDAIAVAIKNRGTTSGSCTTTAEVWWVPLTGSEVGMAKMVATGGFVDVATDRGRAFYVDDCKGELGEITSTGVKTLRTGLAKPTALAVSKGQAYIGLEASSPATTSLVVASITTTDAPRTLWTEAATQVLNAPNYPGVQRELDAQSVVINQLEVGGGGDYVAITTAAQFHGLHISAANFPEMIISTEELRVFDAATGGVLQRYRSWCDGVYYVGQFDIDLWACATTTGQSQPSMDKYDHHISSMAFLYGKK